MAQEEDWQQRLTKSVAAQVRRYRQQRKLSVQKLSDRCEELGMGIPRPVLTNLETGRRESVTLAELLVLAAALDVPPVLLVAPLGYQETTEILPGREMPTFDAVLWQSGDARLLDDSSGDQTEYLYPEDERAVVALYHEHEQLVGNLLRDGWPIVTDALGGKLPVLTGENGETVLSAEEYVKSLSEYNELTADDLRQLRARMRERGLLPPALPAALEYIDSDRPRRRGRPRR